MKKLAAHILRLCFILAAGYGVALLAAGLVSEVLVGIGGLSPSQATLGGLIIAIPTGALASMLCWSASRQVGRLAKPTPRQASWRELHHILAIGFAAPLYVICLAGTLSVFDLELDRWSIPRLRKTNAPPLPPSTIFEEARRLAPDAVKWTIRLPSERVPVTRLQIHREGEETASRYLGDAAGSITEWPSDIPVGTGFFVPLHSAFLLSQGHWFTSTSAWAWLLISLSGLIIHRRLLADFFLLRPAVGKRAMTRDLHTLLGGAGLVYGLLVAGSGLLMFAATLFSPSLVAFERNPEKLESALSLTCNSSATGRASPIVPIEQVIARSRVEWNGSSPARIVVSHPYDTGGTVAVYRTREDAVSLGRDGLCLRAPDGTLIAMAESGGAFQDSEQFLMGVHTGQHAKPALRWLQFVVGAAFCAIVAMGLYHWANSARPVEHRWRMVFADAVVLSPVAGAAVALFASQCVSMTQPEWQGILTVCFFGSAGTCALGGWLLPHLPRLAPLGLTAIAAIGASASNVWRTPGAMSRDMAPAAVNLALLCMATLALMALLPPLRDARRRRVS